MTSAAPILPKDVAWPVPARRVANCPGGQLDRDPVARPVDYEDDSSLKRREVLTNPRHDAADALDAHPSAEVRAIGRWIRAGARGDLNRYLEGGDRHAVAERDRLLRDLAATLWPGEKPSVAARADYIATELTRYAATRWRFDRAATVNPHPARSMRGTLWEVLKLRDVVLSPRQVRKILSVPQNDAERDSFTY